MASKPPTTIADLPNELLSHIISLLDTPAPSSTRLHDQPSTDLLRRPPERQPLKSASLVSHLWRAVTLPFLFRHVLWSLQGWDIPSLYGRLAAGNNKDQKATEDTELSLSLPLRFLRDKGLTGSRIDSFTLVLCDAADDFATLTSELVTLDVGGRQENARYGRDYNWLWRAIFDVVDPLRFTLVSRPRMLATVFSRSLYLGDEWSFASAEHIVSLSRNDRTPVPTCAPPDPNRKLPNLPAASSASEPRQAPPTPCCDLFTLRPWTSALVNEGSQTRVYKTYEFFLKRPPSILASLLGAEPRPPDDVALLGPYVRDLSYVAIFPLSTHFHTLVTHIPTHLDRLFVQLVPRNDILRDPREMKHVDVSDLWMERNTAYSMLMREMFHPAAGSRWGGLKVFESGDSADREAWDMAVRYVSHSPSTGWKVEREGVFVRNVEESDDEEEPQTSHLRRMAFNGVATLPVSARWLYM